jgi:hypothetical protein
MYLISRGERYAINYSLGYASFIEYLFTLCNNFAIAVHLLI